MLKQGKLKFDKTQSKEFVQERRKKQKSSSIRFWNEDSNSELVIPENISSKELDEYLKSQLNIVDNKICEMILKRNMIAERLFELQSANRNFNGNDENLEIEKINILSKENSREEERNKNIYNLAINIFDKSNFELFTLNSENIIDDSIYLFKNNKNGNKPSVESISNSNIYANSIKDKILLKDCDDVNENKSMDISTQEAVEKAEDLGLKFHSKEFIKEKLVDIQKFNLDSQLPEIFLKGYKNFSL